MTEVTVDTETIPAPTFLGVDPGAPDFVIAAAKQIRQATYWPSLDYPDREEWLKKRAAQHDKAPQRRVYSGRKPLQLGINAAKRMAVVDAIAAGESPNPKRHRGKRIVVHRHGYYRDRYNKE